jgi:hypothetical protein
LQTRHGRVVFVYDAAVDGVVRVIGEHEDTRTLQIAFPHSDPDGHMKIVPGLSEPDDVLGWTREARDHIGGIGSRVLVTAVCEHIREAEAERFGWELHDLFADHPTAWLCYAMMPIVDPT